MYSRSLPSTRNGFPLLQQQRQPVKWAAAGHVTVCGTKEAKKEAKAIRKQLHTQREDIARITADLQSPAGPSRSLAAVVASLQEFGGKLEEMAGTVDQLSSSSSSSSSSDSECEEPQQQRGASVAAESGRTLTAEVGHPSPDNGVLQGALSTADAGRAAGTFAVPPLVAAVDLHSAEHRGSAAATAQERTGSTESPDLWRNALCVLGASPEGRIAVCQGKACVRAGSAQVLQDISAAAEPLSGLDVVPCKCLDVCRQGPNLQVTASGAKAVLLTSREDTKKKKKKFGNIVTKTKSASSAKVVT